MRRDSWPRRSLAIAVPLALGVLVAAWLIAGRAPPERESAGEDARPVTAIAAPETEWRPRATGYGTARAARTWRGVAEVSGRIVERSPDLDTGAIVARGAQLFEIDRTDYRLAIAEARAGISAGEARLTELDTRAANLERSLDIEQRRLEVAQRELDRLRTLFERGTVPRADVDRQESAFLQQRQAVQELENSVRQIPAERQRLQAELARDGARLSQARRNLTKTRITAPFDLRISAVDAEVGQYVRSGEVLMSGDSVAATEVQAEIPINEFRTVLDPARRPESPVDVTDLDQLLAAMGLTARVHLRASPGPEPTATWPARVDRISGAIDPRTRTVGVIVTVDSPYANARPPERPPLVKGMYVEVRVCAPARPAAVVVPRTALHGNRIYIADAVDRLDIREVDLIYRHGGFAVVRDGVKAGERVVVSDPVPAIDGMKLGVHTDEAAASSLAAEARGAGTCP